MDKDNFEHWAETQTTAGGFYSYRDVLDDAGVGQGTGSPGWCRPNRCFRDTDRRRHNRTRGRGQAATEMADHADDRGPIGLAYTDDDRDLSHQLQGHNRSNLLAFHLEMNAGTGTSRKGHSGWTRGYGFEKTADPNQIEVCRECRRDLGLFRDDDGLVVRTFKGQPQYCSDRCEADADNRRDRQRRAGGKFPKNPETFWSMTKGISTTGDERPWRSCWYVGSDPKADVEGDRRRRRMRHPRAHVYMVHHEAVVAQTVSKDYRLVRRDLTTWRIAQVTVTGSLPGYGALAS